MNTLNNITIEVALFLKGHIQFITMSVITTLLMVYGNSINRLFRSLTRSLHSVFRFILFMLLCSIGYAFVATALTRFIRAELIALPAGTFLIVLSIIFLILGTLAKRNGEI